MAILFSDSGIKICVYINSMHLIASTPCSETDIGNSLYDINKLYIFVQSLLIRKDTNK